MASGTASRAELTSSPINSKISPANPIHSFFTPRRRPLKALTPSGNNVQVRNLSSTDNSPSQAKRQRLSTSFFGGAETAGFLNEAEDEREQATPNLPLPRTIRPNSARRLLMRSIGGLYPNRAAHMPFHCAHWSTDILKFCSRPEDTHTVLGPEGQPSLPFAAQACNRNPLVAIGDESGSVRLVESAKDEKPGFTIPFLKMECHENAVFDISFSPDDFQMATACGDQSVRLIDVRRQECTSILQGHRSSVKQVVFSPDNPSVLSSCSRDGSILIWDIRCVGTRVADTEVVAHKPVNFLHRAHAPAASKKGGRKREDVSVTAVAWPWMHTIASASEYNAEIKWWDTRFNHGKRTTAVALESSELPQHHIRPFGLNSLTLSHDKSLIYSLCRDSIVYAWSTRHPWKGPIRAYTHPRLHASTFYVKTSVSNDGQYLATGSSDGVALLFPLAEEYFDRNLYSHNFNHPEGSRAWQAAKEMPVGRGIALIRGHEKEVTDVTWTCRGDMVAISDDYQARCWRAEGHGEDAENMREGGELEGRRWGWGWAEADPDDTPSTETVGV